MSVKCKQGKELSSWQQTLETYKSFNTSRFTEEKCSALQELKCGNGNSHMQLHTFAGINHPFGDIKSALTLAGMVLVIKLICFSSIMLQIGLLLECGIHGSDDSGFSEHEAVHHYHPMLPLQGLVYRKSHVLNESALKPWRT